MADVVTFTVGGKSQEIGTGDVLFITRGAVRSFTNASGAPATCLCVLTPGVLGPEYFREIADLVATGTPHVTRVRETILRHGLVPADLG
ncbi:cupin domain-containing protein [uncultured Methylobacterium sp.]|uniref:cupin domain-containing protein n=1 Tax=uncultured Methylobacterium sp. TaxID=157278 RepID=UPI002624A0AD|nr:cupin domain-containing protein [uncultured Methylobacterium sp.]